MLKNDMTASSKAFLHAWHKTWRDVEAWRERDDNVKSMKMKNRQLKLNRDGIIKIKMRKMKT